jgi:hypothetical protein
MLLQNTEPHGSPTLLLADFTARPSASCNAKPAITGGHTQKFETSVRFNPEAYQVLLRLAEEQKTNKCTVIEKALESYDQELVRLDGQINGGGLRFTQTLFLEHAILNYFLQWRKLRERLRGESV